jgi:hypothetical protein
VGRENRCKERETQVWMGEIDKIKKFLLRGGDLKLGR